MTSQIYCSAPVKYSGLKKFAQFFYLRKLSIEEILKESLKYTLNPFLYEQLENLKPAEFKDDMEVRAFYERLMLIEKRMKENKHTPNLKSYATGNCRDNSLFVYSILMYKQIPARVRSGFGTFFEKVKKYDHWICEYWNETEKRWQGVDSWMYQIKMYVDKIPPFFRKKFSALDFNPLDVDKKFFMTGAEAWKLCRENKDDFENYTIIPEKKGEWFVRDNMIHDLYCLNDQVTLPWDYWGKMGPENTKMDSQYYDFLNRTSSVLLSDYISIEQVQSLINEYEAVYNKN